MRQPLPQTEAERARRRKASRQSTRRAIFVVAALVAVVGLGLRVEETADSSPDGSHGNNHVRWAGPGGTGLGPHVRWAHAPNTPPDAPSPDDRPAPLPVDEEHATAMRMVLSPEVFALATPVGFTRLLEEEHPAMPEPGQAETDGPPADAALASPLASPPSATAVSAMLDASGTSADAAPSAARPDRPTGLSLGERWTPPPPSAAETGMGLLPGNGVFAARQASPGARMEFSAGWESRMFSGMELDYGTWWPGQDWQASIEVEFDHVGVPVHVLLTTRSGNAPVDARLVRGAYGWRLRDRAALRRGTVTWVVPASDTPLPSPSADATMAANNAFPSLPAAPSELPAAALLAPPATPTTGGNADD
ncbi:MAG: hypothetical protein ILO10_07995 [Kiritimatiellae bacterium]|nr:hypothetical protein [Kiritimatiellia bacterium]